MALSNSQIDRLGDRQHQTTYFLLEYDRREHRPKWTTFEEARPALDALREREGSRLDHVEVVLLMATSLDDLRKTHPRYFPGELDKMFDSTAAIAELMDEALRRAIAAQAS
jgi:hypothetical protein